MKRPAITTIPERFKEQDKQDNNHKIIHKEYQFELLTPMFGGDHTSWKLDTKNPIRGSSVKGQLRFWWRTLQNETTPEQLLSQENQRWGGNISNTSEQASIKSPITLAILSQTDITTEIIQANVKGNALGHNCIPNYVLFPVTELVTKKKEKIQVITQLKFTLLISYPEQYQQEVTDTLTLWTLFGGVGARTRRGTGSIYCAELMRPFKNKQAIKKWLDERGRHPSQTMDYARIAGAEFFVDDSHNHASTQSIWSTLLEDYGKYRQDRRKGNPRPGRSFWPEPDAIRTVSRQSSPSHSEPVNDENWFPRAAFGLPILTTFSTSGDPIPGKSIHLEPDIADLDKSERFPSPMILKVIKLGSGEVLSCCLVLNQKFPERLTLKVADKEHRLTAEQHPFGHYKNRTMKTNEPLLKDESIYQHLARSLELEQVI